MVENARFLSDCHVWVQLRLLHLIFGQLFSSQHFNVIRIVSRKDFILSQPSLALILGIGLGNIAKADGHSVVFASWGGSFQDALRSSMLTPAAQDLGIEVKEDTTNGIQDIRTQISANAVAWDVHRHPNAVLT